MEIQQKDSMEVNRSLGVTDNTEHYGCFDKGSSPLETSVHKFPLFTVREQRTNVNKQVRLAELV